MSRKLKPRIMKYKLRRTGRKFGKMIKLCFAIVYLYRLLKRFCNQQIQKAANIWFTPEFFKNNLAYGTPTWNLWVVPRETNKLYIFCPDKRTSMRKLLCKTNHGLSPPELYTALRISPFYKKKRY